MDSINSIKRPTLLLDKKKCLNNIEKMLNKAVKHGINLRPHFKTHQSVEIGKWFANREINAITVSSLSMAAYFAGAGWNDITVAFPVNIREIDAINQLAGKINLNLLVESDATTTFLAKHLQAPVNLFIKIDTGYHRTGLGLSQTEEIEKILDIINKNSLLNFRGFLTHSGHTYKARSVDEIQKIHNTSLEQLTTLKEKYAAAFPDLIISIGDTPSCSLMNDFRNVDEIRPGNFVFYDVMQWDIGSCTLEEIAVALACPVVAKHDQRGEIVLYAGAVHLSKESIKLNDGRPCYGLMVELQQKGWKIPSKIIPLTALSQEHGILSVDKETMKKISVGDLVGILPVHSCLTANLMKGYLSLDGQKIDHYNAKVNVLQD